MRFNNLEKFQRNKRGDVMELSIPLPHTPEGRVYRYSPNQDAHPRHFVLGDRVAGFEPRAELKTRMKQDPGKSQTVCPYSGIIADDTEFNHPDDVEAGMEIVKHAALEDMLGGFSDMLDDVARSTRGNKFIKIEHKGGHRPSLPPRFGRRDLMRALMCDHCGRDYGVYAIALYCPDCGAPNVRLHFAREVELVSRQVDLADGLAPEAEELAYRLLGNAHEDVLSAFEATMKTVYAQLIAGSADLKDTVKRVGNEFQNIERGRERFEPLGFDPFAVLSADEPAVLALNIQKRHVVGHNLGMVDEKFASIEAGAKLGETVKLVGSDIKLFAAVAQKVVTGLDEKLAPDGAAAAPPIGEPISPVEVKDALPDETPPLKERIACWLCKESDNGIAGWMRNMKPFVQAFEGESEDDLVLALADLKLDGLIDTRSLGEGIPMVKVEAGLYATYDPMVHQTDPYQDAAAIAEILLADANNSINAAALFEKAGWDRRRFNPALSIVVSEAGEGRVSRTWDDEHGVGFFALIPEDRARLKRFAARVHGG